MVCSIDIEVACRFPDSQIVVINFCDKPTINLGFSGIIRPYMHPWHSILHLHLWARNPICTGEHAIIVRSDISQQEQISGKTCSFVGVVSFIKLFVICFTHVDFYGFLHMFPIASILRLTSNFCFDTFPFQTNSYQTWRYLSYNSKNDIHGSSIYELIYTKHVFFLFADWKGSVSRLSRWNSHQTVEAFKV